jgi:uncharacterized protein YgiM (DUF1202 family)
LAFPEAHVGRRIGYLDRVLNLREGPGTSYASRGEVGGGRRVEILDQSGDWAQVRVENGDSAGKVGWLWRHDLTMDR